jgi:hypothetical protein
VKLWSMTHSLQGEYETVSSCARCYYGHQRSVFDVLYSSQWRKVASCDGSIHVSGKKEFFFFCFLSSV